jgi:hypothetical protein
MPIVESYPHRTGEHCASTALRNVLAHGGMKLSEGMVFGLASGLGFVYLRSDEMSPSRMFHGRTWTLEADFGRNTGIAFEDRPEPDAERAWQAVRERIDRGQPVMVSTDTFYLGYHDTTSHFPGHRCVVVGYDDASQTVLIADRKFEEYQRCSYEELRDSRNAPDYPMRCDNQYGDFDGPIRLGRPLEEAIRVALEKTANTMLEPSSELGFASGVPAIRELAEDFPRWAEIEDWSWASRFGYQVVEKRGAAGTFFRKLQADFLRESADVLPVLGREGFADRMDGIAARWLDLSALLKQQSEIDVCDPTLFDQAAKITRDLADLEEGLQRDVGRVLAASAA